VPYEFSRSKKVADQLQRELAILIQFKIKDPRIEMVTISGVELSRDLSYAKVFFTVLEKQCNEIKKIKITLDALNHAKRFIRTKIAKNMQLRIVPELRFYYDTSIKYGNHLGNLIDQARILDSNSNDH